MRIVILSTNPRIYSTRRLKEACRQRGHKVRVLDTLSFSIVVEQKKPTLYHHGKLVPRIDAVIPRVGASVSFFGTAVVRQFEEMGVFCLNSSQAISVARDKLRSMQALSTHTVGIPKTAFVRRKEDLLAALDAVGGPPVIIKLLEGTQGIGVMLAHDTKTAEAIIETLHSARQNVLIQNFVKESRGRDIRAFVVGNRVVAAMRRVAQGGEFRSNVHRGAIAGPVRLDPLYEATAIRAAQVMGLRVAGVDMLESDEGPKVMEVNSSPGLEGIEGATGVDVAGAIIEHVEQEVRFPELDIKQKLRLSGGYGIMEVVVEPRSQLAHHPIVETHLRQLDVQILTITRGSVVIPNPKPETEILPGDVLLCFGPGLAMRGLRSESGTKKKSRSKSSTASKPPRSRPRTRRLLLR